MNKTISINIGGFVFNIEENAYQKLYHYLQAIKKNFGDTDEREEIMNDIESRIAELFQEKIGPNKEVVTEKDVDHVVEIMGKPEDYATGDFSEDQKKSEQQTNDSNYRNASEKRLFRDTENASLGGVASGLAHYFNLDVTLVRILFILLTILGGSGILIYIILLIAVPEAKSTTDKFQMRGEAINLDNIKEHFNKLKNDIKENTKSGRFKKGFNQTVDKGVRMGSSFVKAFSKIIGLSLIIGGCFALLLLTVLLFDDSGFLPLVGTENTETLPTFLDIIYPSSTSSSFVFLSIILVILIPIISIIVSGIKILFKIQKSFKTVAISSSVIWFVSIGILAITGINLGMEFKNETSIEYIVPYNSTNDILLVDVSNDDKFSNHIAYCDVWNQSELVKVEDEKIFLGYPELIVTEKEDSSGFEILLHKQSNGKTTKSAIDKAEHINYVLKISDNKLTLPPYFTVPKSDKLRNQRIIIEIKVPLGKKIKFGKNIDRLDIWVSGEQNYEEEMFSNTTWIARETQMVCLACKKVKQYYVE